MIDSLDIKGLMDAYDISYRAKGKNVARGDLNLEVCPFCGNAAFHCCVNIYKPIWQCWVCGEKGFITKLLREMEVFQGKNIGKIIQPYIQDGTLTQLEGMTPNLRQPEQPNKRFLMLPKGILTNLPQPHRNYLISRGFDPDYLLKKYKLQAVYNIGEQKYKFRIIVPIFLNGKMVAFLGAATLRHEGVVKYINCTEEESILPISHCLYNMDSVNDVAVIVEGVTDVWRMGDGFIATFRKHMTKEQMELLVRKRPKRVFVMYDSDATQQANELADNLCQLFPYVEVLELEKGDPADLSLQEAQEIRELIFRKNIF